jgi:hypothetical protein
MKMLEDLFNKDEVQAIKTIYSSLGDSPKGYLDMEGYGEWYVHGV